MNANESNRKFRFDVSLPSVGAGIEALKELSEVSQEAAFRKKKLTMGGYLLTRTKLARIPGAEDLGWQELEMDYQILRQEGDYLEKVLTVGLKHTSTLAANSSNMTN
jgi:hypothetical protein